MRKLKFTWLAICLVGLLPAGFALAATGYIVRDGMPHAAVVVPAMPTVSEHFAAGELIAYIAKITGGKLPQINEPVLPASFPIRIFVGQTAEALRHKLTFAEQVKLDDAFIIETKGNDLFILGKGDRGTLYGVYEFLERQGVRWLMPTEIGEVIPQKTSLILDEYHTLKQPAFQYRRFALLATPRSMKRPNYQWQVRLGLNSGIRGETVKKMGGITGIGPISHNYRRLIDKDLFDRHPEYFALVKGKRRDPRKQKQYWKMCLSNPAVIEIAVQNTIDYLKKHPQTDFFSLAPNDGKNWCEDDACRMLQDPATGQSGPVFFFAKKIIERVGPLFPRVYFPVLSYDGYKFPPRDFVAPKGLMINITVGGDFSKAITEPGHEKTRRQFESWKKQDVPLWVYSFTSKMAFLQLPWPIFRNTIQNIQYYRDMGAIGFFGQGSGQNWGPNGLQYYMVAKALWNPDFDVEALFDDYCEKGFGPAGEAVKEYYNTYWHAVRTKNVPIKRAPDARGWSIFESAIDIYTPDVLIKARAALNRAFLLARDQPDITKRLNLLEVSQSYAEKFIPFAAAHRIWRRNPRDRDAKDTTIAHAKDVVGYLDQKAPQEPWALVYSSKNNPYAANKLPRRVMFIGPRK